MEVEEILRRGYVPPPDDKVAPEHKIIVKGRGFFPNPVAVAGIPDYADSVRFPEVVGTPEHEAWWYEQFRICEEGYTTGGVWIPPIYYYYLNFTYISTVGRGNHHPEFVDSDLEFFEMVHWCKENGWGMIVLKARRRGLSEKLKCIINWGLRFGGKGYKAGIVAGMQTYATQLFAKVKYHNSLVAPELFVHTTGSDEVYKLTYQSKTRNGWKHDGSMNEVLCKTAGKDANIMKGNLFYDMAFEEAGEFDLLEETFNASKDCYMDGDNMIGFPIIFGTGGDINSSSKGFQKMWESAEDYKLKRYRVHAQRIYKECFVGSRDKRGNLNHQCPNILNNPKYKGLSYEQVLGCEDTEDALKRIVKKKEELGRSKDRGKLFAFMQNNPTNDRECFLKFTGNKFDPIVLDKNRDAIISNPYQFRPYLIDFLLDDKHKPVMPLQLDMKNIRVAVTDDELDRAIFIHKFPIKGFKNHQVAGIDSYDVDETTTSKSLGAMVVLARDMAVKEEDQMRPLCLVRQRPLRKEIFWDNCLKVAILYDLICDSRGGNVLVDNGKPGVIEWFKRFGGTKFLAIRPQSLESEGSEQHNEYGINVTTRSKPTLISYCQTWVLDHGMKNVFPQLNAELQDYDVNTKDSDNDCVDATMYALARHYDMKYQPISDNEKEEVDIYPVESYRDKSFSNFDDVMMQVNSRELITENGTRVDNWMSKYVYGGGQGEDY